MHRRAVTAELCRHGEHSYAQLTPFRRLVHTGNAFEKIYFGTRAEADRVLAYVRGLHEHVRGTLPEAAGITPREPPTRRSIPR